MSAGRARREEARDDNLYAAPPHLLEPLVPGDLRRLVLAVLL